MDLDEVNAAIKKQWEASGGRVTYIGDWHTHPEYRPIPSSIDRNTFRDTYRASSFDQNLLICAIIGTAAFLEGGVWIGAQRWFRLYNLRNIGTNGNLIWSWE